MTHLRTWIATHPWIAASLIAMALLVRALVPGGYMIATTGGTITVQVCAETGMTPEQITIALPGGGHDGTDGDGDARAKMPCAFAGLAMPMLAGADPIQLAIALVAILALGLAARQVPTLRTVARLRPPSHAPPLTA
ncbi:hypothetical protein GO308_08745 [Sphingomonas sp. SFZ2018-12]|uniref:hypothetical protein n=1 Tax=Sphingomonas sp. SFZ2018-12 TaxID=2683197 RepID=UPI001F0F4FBE|nr:hypothetical protein [Sphingomonas sp. SFZ2018-12]MCH4893192.1 hypothetical protein [Sphingomonas sp. SFZ2018-12]